jgi:chitin disaccharide deacetylase
MIRRFFSVFVAAALLAAFFSCSAHLLAQEKPTEKPAEKPAEKAPNAGPPRLIIRGDDMGFSHSGNEAIQKCYREGIETSVEILAPSPWFPEAAAMLAEHPSIDVGVHLALTSEWDNVKWRPLTEARSLRDEDGYFYPMLRPNKNYPDRSLSEHEWKLEDVEKEFRAQIELVKRKLPRVSHVTGHMGCEGLSPDVKALVKKLCVEYGLDIHLDELGVKNIGYTGPKGTLEEKISSFLKTLDRLEEGQTYMFLDHPGLDTPELRAIHHIGYENVAVDRQGVTDLWTDPRVKKHIEARGIQLIGYDDLKK